MALSDTAHQAVWIKSLLKELGINIPMIPICRDNQGSIFIRSNPVQERHSKHIDIYYHFVRQLMEEKKIDFFFIEGAENPTDLFIKNLVPQSSLNLGNSSDLSFTRPSSILPLEIVMPNLFKDAQQLWKVFSMGVC